MSTIVSDDTMTSSLLVRALSAIQFSAPYSGRIDAHGAPRSIVGVALGPGRQHLVRQVISIAFRHAVYGLAQAVSVGIVRVGHVVARPDLARQLPGQVVAVVGGATTERICLLIFTA